MQDELVTVLLLLSWPLCWYLLFVRRRATTVPVKKSRLFAYSGALMALALGLFSGAMWAGGLPDPLYPALGVPLLFIGQVLMVAARRELPLSGYDVFFSITDVRVHTGPYRFMRHPMYLGLLAACGGTALLVGRAGWWVGVGVGAAVLARVYAEQYGTHTRLKLPCSRGCYKRRE